MATLQHIIAFTGWPLSYSSNEKDLAIGQKLEVKNKIVIKSRDAIVVVKQDLGSLPLQTTSIAIVVV